MPYRLVIVSACAPGVIESRHSSEAQKVTETNFSRPHLGDNCTVSLTNLGMDPEYVR